MVRGIALGFVFMCFSIVIFQSPAHADMCRIECWETFKWKVVAAHYFNFCKVTNPDGSTQIELSGLIEDGDLAYALSWFNPETGQAPDQATSLGMLQLTKFADSNVACSCAREVVRLARVNASNHTFAGTWGFTAGVIVAPVNGYPCANVAHDVRGWIENTLRTIPAECSEPPQLVPAAVATAIAVAE